MDSDAIVEVKTKAKATWATGSYNDIAMFVAPAAHHLVATADVQEGERVLDVATGTGVTAIAARMAGADVVALDLTPQLLAQAAAEERTARMQGIDWREGDAEAMPFPDDAFDVVVSSFGHMFAPRPDVTMREMLRVLKPGGRLAFVTHKKDNVAQAFFAAMAKHLPSPPSQPPSPFAWGDPAVIRERLGPQVSDVRIEEGMLPFAALSPGHFWRLFSTKYGPTMRALDSLGQDRRKLAAIQADFTAAVAPYWQRGRVAMDYLVTRAVKK